MKIREISKIQVKRKMDKENKDYTKKRKKVVKQKQNLSFTESLWEMQNTKIIKTIKEKVKYSKKHKDFKKDKIRMKKAKLWGRKHRPVPP